MYDNKYKTLFFILLSVFITTIITSTIYYFLNNNIVNKKEKEPKIEEKNSNNIEEDKAIKETIKEEDLENTTKDTNEIENDNIEIEKNDNADSEVLSYLKEKENEVYSKITDGTYKENLKNIFIEVVDFLFYDGKIKDHSFNELTEKGKLEVIKIVIKIEDKIEQYQPGLVDNIGNKYTNIKSKIIELYDEKVNEYCSNHMNLCSQAKKDYNSIKNSFKNAFNTAKNKISNFYQEKIKKSN